MRYFLSDKRVMDLPRRGIDRRAKVCFGPSLRCFKRRIDSPPIFEARPAGFLFFFR